MAEHHGMYGTPTYKSWSEMKYRCGNLKKPDYVNISYSDSWKDFRIFFMDMGIRPKGTSLDRIDGTKGYSKNNCRWATDLEQQNNRSNNHRFEYNGELLTIPQLSRKYGIKRSTLANRIYIYNMNITEAIEYKKGGVLNRRA